MIDHARHISNPHIWPRCRSSFLVYRYIGLRALKNTIYLTIFVQISVNLGTRVNIHTDVSLTVTIALLLVFYVNLTKYKC